mgnify:CR=1 FL=1
MIRPSPSRGDVVAYDFRRPSRISADRQRNLGASHEQLAQALQRWVSGRLRSSFEVHLQSVQQETYGEFVNSLSDPCVAFLYDIRNMPGMSVAVALDSRIAFLLIERLLGGGSVSPEPGRPLTLLESVVMRLVTDRIVKEVSEVWKDHMQLDCEFSRFEAAQDLIEMTGREEDILLTTLQVAVQDVKGVIQFALPFPVLETFFSPAQTIRVQAPSRTPAERATDERTIERTVRRAHVVISARLPGPRTSLGALAGMKEGDVFEIQAAAPDLVDVYVAGQLRFRAKQGRLGPNLGVQIIEEVGDNA